jgi:hypothetical protein
MWSAVRRPRQSGARSTSVTPSSSFGCDTPVERPRPPGSPLPRSSDVRAGAPGGGRRSFTVTGQRDAGAIVVVMAPMTQHGVIGDVTTSEA